MTAAVESTKMTYRVNGLLLSLLLNHVSTDPTRPSLAGVMFFPNEMVATSGHTLARFALPEGSMPRVTIVFSPAAARLIQKAAKKKAEVEIIRDTDWCWQVAYLNSREIVATIDFPTPEWRKTIPTTEPVALTQLGIDAEKLALFTRATEKAMGGYVYLTFYGQEKAVMVRYQNELLMKEHGFIGLIMPVRLA